MTSSVPPAMRRVVVHADHIEVATNAAIPEPRPHEVLVRSVLSGVCGSDTNAARGRHPFIPIPYHPGHEVVGVVERLGSQVTGPGVGQRITVEPYLPCWHCKMCRTGRPNLCENLQFFGCGWEQGGMADWFTVPADRLHAIPDDLDNTTATLIEPLSTPVHAVRLAGDASGVAGKAVAILGGGTIGLLALAVLKDHNVGRVVVTDMLGAKRDRALALGADAALDAGATDVVEQVRFALGQSADIVFDCVAIETTVRHAIGIASKGGTVVVVGVPPADVCVPLAIVQDHQIRIQGSATYLPEDYRASIDMLQRRAVRAADFVTATRPLEQVADAFQLSASGEHVKVLVTVEVPPSASRVPPSQVSPAGGSNRRLSR